jgi:hypothetical protein
MTSGQVVTGTLHRVQRRHGKGFVAELPPPMVQVRRPARVAAMLALAHQIAAGIAGGHLPDQADVARRLGVTRARVTQLLALLQLAPDLQERVLFLEAVDGIEPLTERGLRVVTRARSWADQRALLATAFPMSPSTCPNLPADHVRIGQ